MKTPMLVVATLIGLRTAGLATPVLAAPPVALIEEVQGEVAGAELMDYVVPGQVIKLGPDATLVLSYLKSCRRETVNGTGSVTVGRSCRRLSSVELHPDHSGVSSAMSQRPIAALNFSWLA